MAPGAEAAAGGGEKKKAPVFALLTRRKQLEVVVETSDANKVEGVTRRSPSCSDRGLMWFQIGQQKFYHHEKRAAWKPRKSAQSPTAKKWTPPKGIDIIQGSTGGGAKDNTLPDLSRRSSPGWAVFCSPMGSSAGGGPGDQGGREGYEGEEDWELDDRSSAPVWGGRWARSPLQEIERLRAPSFTGFEFVRMSGGRSFSTTLPCPLQFSPLSKPLVPVDGLEIGTGSDGSGAEGGGTDGLIMGTEGEGSGSEDEDAEADGSYSPLSSTRNLLYSPVTTHQVGWPENGMMQQDTGSTTDPAPSTTNPAPSTHSLISGRVGGSDTCSLSHAPATPAQPHLHEPAGFRPFPDCSAQEVDCTSSSYSQHGADAAPLPDTVAVQREQYRATISHDIGISTAEKTPHKTPTPSISARGLAEDQQVQSKQHSNLTEAATDVSSPVHGVVKTPATSTPDVFSPLLGIINTPATSTPDISSPLLGVISTPATSTPHVSSPSQLVVSTPAARDQPQHQEHQQKGKASRQGKKEAHAVTVASAVTRANAVKAACAITGQGPASPTAATEGADAAEPVARTPAGQRPSQMQRGLKLKGEEVTQNQLGMKLEGEERAEPKRGTKLKKEEVTQLQLDFQPRQEEAAAAASAKLVQAAAGRDVRAEVRPDLVPACEVTRAGVASCDDAIGPGQVTGADCMLDGALCVELAIVDSGENDEPASANLGENDADADVDSFMLSAASSCSGWAASVASQDAYSLDAHEAAFYSPASSVDGDGDVSLDVKLWCQRNAALPMPHLSSYAPSNDVRAPARVPSSSPHLKPGFEFRSRSRLVREGMLPDAQLRALRLRMERVREWLVDQEDRMVERLEQQLEESCHVQ